MTIKVRKSIILEVEFMGEADGSDKATDKETPSGDQPVEIQGDLWINF